MTSNYVQTNIQSKVFDYEEGWGDLVHAMSHSTQKALSFPNNSPSQTHTYDTKTNHNHKCQFGGKCDITQSLSHPSNHKFLESIPNTQLFLCQYCVAENAVKLRDSDFVFFQELFEAASIHTLFAFTETTHRLWPDFIDLIQESITTDRNVSYSIHFPKQPSSGFQMFLHKIPISSSSTTSSSPNTKIHPSVIQQCEEFRKDHIMHELKLEKGFTRQQKKIRGGR